MASNSFGNQFRITTWGESHGKAIGVVIDGCPAGLELCDQDIRIALEQRSPGRNPYTSPRNESDIPEILSGIFEGKTTGTPISILIPNRDADSSKYEPIKNHLRPGHANFSYLKKYGRFDYRGGGRASARETACRVAAGAVAKKILGHFGIKVAAFLKQIDSLSCEYIASSIEDLQSATYKSPLFCPCTQTTEAMIALIEQVKHEGESVGGIVEFIVEGAPSGLGDPVYEKLEANLAKAMMSLPASKGFEIGSGFKSSSMKGSAHNDLFTNRDGAVQTATNYAGGTLGGISTGMPIIGKVAFKPASSIKKTQSTLTLDGQLTLHELPVGSRHDPCVAIRAVPVVEAMAALAIVDALLQNRMARL